MQDEGMVGCQEGRGPRLRQSPSAAATTTRPVGPPVEEKREGGADLATPAAWRTIEKTGPQMVLTMPTATIDCSHRVSSATIY
jgi:hypothetical protein